MTYIVKPPSDVAEPGAGGRGVADDMAAIFGPDVRAGAGVAGLPAVVPARPRRPRWLLAGLGAGVLAATVAAGVWTGRNAVGVPDAAPSPAATRARPPVERPREVEAPVVTSVDSASVPAPAVVPVPAPSPVADTAAVREAPAPAPRPPLVLSLPPSPTPTPAPAPRAPVAAPAAASVPRPAPAAVAAEPEPRVASRPVDCDDNGLCVAPSLGVAERRLANAWRQAVAAGVSPRILRGYQREWDRARGEAEARPDHALRLYAMITSDLGQFTAEAEGRDGPSPR